MLMQPAPKILILESNLIIAADVSVQLSKLGCEVTGMLTRSADVFTVIENNRPDVVLMNIDIRAKGERIKTAGILSKTFRIPVIFLSAHTGLEIFTQVVHTRPYAFITKPFDIKDLYRGLKTAFDRMNAEEENIRYYPLKAIKHEPPGFIIQPFGRRGLPFGKKL